MEILRYVYFLLMIIYIIRAIILRSKRSRWLLIMSAITIHAFYFFGWNGILFLISAAIISTLAELMCLKTRFNVFGVAYKYNLNHRYFSSRKVMGSVLPIEVSAAWALLKYLSFFLALIILTPLGIHGIPKAIVSALILVSFDLLLDPHAVANGAWEWKGTGWFFEIPWQNFLGWIIVGFTISLIFINLQPIVPIDFAMSIPLVTTAAMFPLFIIKKLWVRNKFKAVLALAPLAIVVMAAVLSL